MQDYSRFLKIYANLPEKLREGIIVVIDGKPYTWNSSYIEITNDTQLGRDIYKKLIKMEII